MQVPDWYDRTVSRETVDRLRLYEELVLRWTKKINLIAPSTQGDVFGRHIWDSAQAYRQIDGHWLDLGSGGGFPGVVVAILSEEDGRSGTISLVESDQRKATFLRTCVRQLGLGATVLSDRVENLAPQSAKVVSARALANLSKLLDHAAVHLIEGGACVFLKGAKWPSEIAAAQEKWHFTYEAQPSKTEAGAAVLTLKDIKRA